MEKMRCENTELFIWVLVPEPDGQAWLNHLHGDLFEARCGIRTESLNLAMKVMREAEIDISHRNQKCFDLVKAERYFLCHYGV
jgi:hypothetical protein